MLIQPVEPQAFDVTEADYFVAERRKPSGITLRNTNDSPGGSRRTATDRTATDRTATNRTATNRTATDHPAVGSKVEGTGKTHHPRIRQISIIFG